MYRRMRRAWVACSHGLKPDVLLAKELMTVTVSNKSFANSSNVVNISLRAVLRFAQVNPGLAINIALASDIHAHDALAETLQLFRPATDRPCRSRVPHRHTSDSIRGLQHQTTRSRSAS
jgi:hypothetical protein